MTLPLRNKRQKPPDVASKLLVSSYGLSEPQPSALHPRKISLTQKKVPASAKGSGLTKPQCTGTPIVVAQTLLLGFWAVFVGLGKEMCQSLPKDQAHHFTKLRGG
jgi:hypothetical protein